MGPTCQLPPLTIACYRHCAQSSPSMLAVRGSGWSATTTPPRHLIHHDTFFLLHLEKSSPKLHAITLPQAPPPPPPRASSAPPRHPRESRGLNLPGHRFESRILHRASSHQPPPQPRHPEPPRPGHASLSALPQ
jgi:hypothetical protein